MKINTAQTSKLSDEQQKALITIFQRTLQIGAANLGMNRTCLTCCHFNETQESCNYYNPPMRPPARVIVESCPAWGETPF